jgi:hypothetical protein
VVKELWGREDGRRLQLAQGQCKWLALMRVKLNLPCYCCCYLCFHSHFLTWRITATTIHSSKSNKLDPHACARYPTVTCHFRFRWPQLLRVVRRQMYADRPIWRTHRGGTARPCTLRHKLFTEMVTSVFILICTERDIGRLLTQMYRSCNTDRLNKFTGFGLDSGRHFTNWLSEDLLFAGTAPVSQFMIISGCRLPPHSTWWTTYFTFTRSVRSDNQGLILWDNTEERSDKDLTADAKSIAWRLKM